MTVEDSMQHADDRSVLRDRFARFADTRADPERPWRSGTPFEAPPPAVRPSDRELQFAFAANLFDLFRAMAHLPEARIEETPGDLGERLQRKGWQAWELDAPGMVADLDDLAYDAMDRTPTGYRQCRVVDEAGLRDFRQAFLSGFGVPEWAGQAWVDATLSFGLDRAPWQCYVGYLDGEPVASNE